MERIVVIGSGGSGKSTLACQIANIRGIKVVHLDAFYWRSGWVATPEDEWQNIVKGLVVEN